MDELTSEIAPETKPKKHKVWLWVVLITLVVAILGFCICVFVKEGNLSWTSIKSVFQKEETKKDDTATSSTSDSAASSTSSVTASETTSATPTITNTTTADWKTYTNDTYGFQLTLNDLWENYTTYVKDGDENAYKYIYFLLPTTDKMTGDNSLTAYGKAGYASPFVISVYTPSGWAQELIDLEARGIPADPILTTDKYVFSWGQGQSCPPDQCNKNLDVAGIIKTIKLN